METLQKEGAACLAAALRYAERGWRVVILYGLAPDGRCNCGKCDCKKKPCREGSWGKHPRLKEWQKSATTNPEIIKGWWRKYPHSSVGIQMGEESGIVDVELDDEAEVDNYQKVFDGKPPDTLSFKSARGTHYLYKWQPGLPDKGTKKIAGITVRFGGASKGAMSVFPPSRHASGITRSWPEGEDTPLANAKLYVDAAEGYNGNGMLPLSTAEPEQDERGLFKDEWTTAAKPPEHWQDVLANGRPEGHRHNTAIELAGKLIGEMADVFDDDQVARQRLMFSSWNKAENRPRLDDDELNGAWTHALTNEREKRLRLAPAATIASAAKRDADGCLVAEWRLTIVDSEPPTYKLYSPLWPSGPVLLTSRQMRSGEMICEQVLTQLGQWIPNSFNADWRGTEKKAGIAADVVRHAEHEPAIAEHHETYVLALAFSNVLARGMRGRTREPHEAPGMSDVTKYTDGAVVLNFSAVLVDMNYGPVRFTVNALGSLLKRLGATRKQFRSLGGRRYRRMGAESVKALDKLIAGYEAAETRRAHTRGK